MQLPSVFSTFPFFIALTCGMLSCNSVADGPAGEYKQHRYLFMGHTRTDNPRIQRVLPEVEQLDFSPYDMLLLGGDLTFNTTIDTPSVRYVDSLFDLSSPATLVAAGNHDAHDYGILNHFTGRPNFYTHHQDGITFLVLDTQRDTCRILGPQLELIRAVTDTLRKSQQLVVLHHKLIWLADHPELKAQASKVPNAGFCEFSYCLFPNNFWEDVYPLLLTVQQRGIQVLLIGGDVGIKVKFFEHQTPEGIWLLASGMDEGDTDNQALLLTKEGVNGKLSWKSLPLTELEGTGGR